MAHTRSKDHQENKRIHGTTKLQRIPTRLAKKIDESAGATKNHMKSVCSHEDILYPSKDADKTDAQKSA